MEWQEAVEDTLRLWRGLRDSLAEPDDLYLLTEINAICALCERAQSEVEGDELKCDRCLAGQQFGGCKGLNAQMSELVVEHDWEALRELIDLFVEKLEGLSLPGGSS